MTKFVILKPQDNIICKWGTNSSRGHQGLLGKWHLRVWEMEEEWDLGKE